MKLNGKYDKLLAEINEIMAENDILDYHAFVYWFIESMYGLEKTKILNAICDKTHDKGVDAVLIDDIERRVLVFQSKFERGENFVQVKDSELKLLGAVKDYLKNRWMQ